MTCAVLVACSWIHPRLNQRGRVRSFSSDARSKPACFQHAIVAAAAAFDVAAVDSAQLEVSARPCVVGLST
eukprot:6201348-Pleurochrysis_carterae.AAC.1